MYGLPIKKIEFHTEHNHDLVLSMDAQVSSGEKQDNGMALVRVRLPSQVGERFHTAANPAVPARQSDTLTKWIHKNQMMHTFFLYDMLKSNASSMFLSDDLSYCEGVGSGLEFIVISVLFTTTLNPAARQDIHESD